MAPSSYSVCAVGATVLREFISLVPANKAPLFTVFARGLFHTADEARTVLLLATTRGQQKVHRCHHRACVFLNLASKPQRKRTRWSHGSSETTSQPSPSWENKRHRLHFVGRVIWSPSAGCLCCGCAVSVVFLPRSPSGRESVCWYGHSAVLLSFESHRVTATRKERPKGRCRRRCSSDCDY